VFPVLHVDGITRNRVVEFTFKIIPSWLSRVFNVLVTKLLQAVNSKL